MTDQELTAKKAEQKAIRAEKEKLLIEAKIEKAKKEVEILKMTPEERETEAERLLNEEQEGGDNKEWSFTDDVKLISNELNTPMGDENNGLKWAGIIFAALALLLPFIIGV